MTWLLLKTVFQAGDRITNRKKLDRSPAGEASVASLVAALGIRKSEKILLLAITCTNNIRIVPDVVISDPEEPPPPAR